MEAKGRQGKVGPAAGWNREPRQSMWKRPLCPASSWLSAYRSHRSLGIAASEIMAEVQGKVNLSLGRAAIPLTV